MLFWIFLALALFSLAMMIWGLIASKKIATIKTSSESFADEARVLVNTTEVDLDPSNGKIGFSKKFFYGKKTERAGTIKYSTADMAKAWQSDDPKLRFAITAVIAGLLGIVLFLGLAFISNGGNQTYIGFGIIVFGLLGLRGFLTSFLKAVKQ